MELDEIMETVVNSLDPVVVDGVEYKTKFYQGYITDFNAQTSNEMAWPCIWLLRDFDKDNQNAWTFYNNISVWALNTGDNTMFDPDSLNNNIRPILKPIVDDFIKKMSLAGVWIESDRTEIERPKIGVKTVNEPLDGRAQNPFNHTCDGIELNLNIRIQRIYH